MSSHRIIMVRICSVFAACAHRALAPTTILLWRIALHRLLSPREKGTRHVNLMLTEVEKHDGIIIMVRGRCVANLVFFPKMKKNM